MNSYQMVLHRPVATAHVSGSFASWCQTNPLSSILWKFKRHYQKPLCTLSMRGTTGQLRTNLQPEARQLALLQVVVNEEADSDGQWNDADRRSCQHIALVQNYVERDKEEHQPKHNREHHNPWTPSIGEASQRIPDAFLLIAGPQQPLDLGDRNTASDHGHALLCLIPALLSLEPDPRNDGDGTDTTTCHRHNKRTGHKILHSTTSSFCPR